MIHQITNEPLFGIFLTLLSFLAFKFICEKIKIPLLNPLILSIVFIIIILKLFNIPFDNYYNGAEIFNTLIIPATVALAIPLYRNFELLKKYSKEILMTIFLSTISLTVLSILIMKFLNFENDIISSLIPKTVTTAIAISLAEKLNGIPSITVICVIVCGNIGALFASPIFSFFKINNPISQGISLGVSSHAVGTARASELGEIQSSMSGLALIITGIILVFTAPLILILFNTVFI